MAQPLFSIIVPFYDTVEYVRETIASIVNQKEITPDDVEIIVVSDGSKQDIKGILADYLNKGLNLTIYEKTNGNWGSVINYVKQNKLVRGQYVTILDSDDKLADNALAIVKKKLINKPDVITANFYRWFATNNKKRKIFVHWLPMSKFFSGEKLAKKMYLLKTAYSFPLAKFYKASLFYETNFSLVEGVSYQDVILFHALIRHAKSWQFIHDFIAYYRTDRKDSSSNVAWSDKRLNNWVQILNCLDANDCTCNAYMYCLVGGFKKAYSKNSYQEPIALHKDFKVVYVHKLLHPLTKLVLKLKIKRLSKKINIKFI